MAGFQKAVRSQKKLKAALLGPAGSGKTRTALEMAKGMGGKIALIDSEHGSASMYAHLVDFDTLELHSFSPDRYIEAINQAEAAGYDVLVIDSLSHAWSGKDGILEFVDRTKKNNNSFNAWGDATPMHNRLVERLLSCKLHLIVTMRTKMEFVQEKDERTGKTTVRKIGMQPVQRDGVEYEFDIICDIDQSHILSVGKTRIDDLDRVVIEKAGAPFGAQIKAWLDGGAPVKEKEKPPVITTEVPLIEDDALVMLKKEVRAEMVKLGITKAADQVAKARELNGNVLPETLEDWSGVRDDLIEEAKKSADDQTKDPPPSSAAA